MEISLVDSQKITTKTTIESNNPTLGYTSRGIEIRISKGHLQFVTALVTRAKILNQPKYPTTDRWIKEMWSVYYKGILFSLKMNEILPFVTTLMELRDVMLRKTAKHRKKNAAYHLDGNPK
jgi:hypothetical protein